MAGAEYPTAQDRKIEIISANPSSDKKKINVNFKITDSNPSARYNVRAYLESRETQGPKPIDVLHNGVEAKAYSMLFSTMGQDGKYFKDDIYNLVLGAVTILNDKPFTIQAHVEIILGAAKQKARQAAERRIEITDFRWVEAETTLAYTIKIISTPALDKPYSVTLFFKATAQKEWQHGRSYLNQENQDPKKIEFSGGSHLPDISPGKYEFIIRVISGDIFIDSELRAIEIKRQPAAQKKREFQVIVTEVKPKQATIPGQGVPAGTRVDYTLEFKNGEPDFTIKTEIMEPRKVYPGLTFTSKSNIFKSWVQFDSPGPSEIRFLVKDKTGKEAKATIPVHISKR